ncbi:MAG: type III secretion system export apparatus subunit SctV [Deltaproteobacteria bacterium]|jgi:type III secretion protein V
MKKLHQTLSALPFAELGRRPDVVFAFGLAAIVAMLIIPMPAVVLDVLIAVNIAFAVSILMVAVFAKRAVDFVSFPTLLLVTTMFRLGLNVSTTRGILASADAGQVVRAFGKFVLQGDVVVGFVIFLVITLVQFLVIAKGAERVAEVGARFTLDAMPGKQMAIDAALRAGAFEEDEAQERRERLGRESQLFGNMDGAMKFVKGDAIAGLIITALNLVAGFVIGVTRDGRPLTDALDIYSVLTVGDGLVSQISALLVTLAAGVMVTRVEGNAEDNLGTTLKTDFARNPTALLVAACLMFFFGLVPGLPALPFFLIGTVVFLASMSRRFVSEIQSRIFPAHAEPEGTGTDFAVELEKKLEQAKAQKGLADQMSPSVVPLGIDFDPVMSRALGFDASAEPEFMTKFIPEIRDAIYLDTGVRVPGIRVRTFVPRLPENTFVIRVVDVPSHQQSLPAGASLALTSPEELQRLGVIAAAIDHPVTGRPMALVEENQKALLEQAGVGTWSLAGIVSLFAAAIIRREVKTFVGLQEVSELVERLEAAYPALVREVVPKVVNIPQLVDVLRRLVDEGVCIRDLKSIVEALGEHGTTNDDTVYLTEKARSALARQLAFDYAGMGRELCVVMLDPLIEETVEGGICRTDDGWCLALDPGVCRTIVSAVNDVVTPVAQAGVRPVILTSARIRRYVKKLIELELPDAAVLSFEELPQDITIHPVGRVDVDAAEAA